MIRLPWVRRSRLTRSEKLYDELWLDHLNRCECHDAWDQCEHSASGRHAEGCGCCKWC